MAHANFHLAVGAAVGTGLGMLPVVRAWLGGAPLAKPVARMLLVTAGLALWAVVPNAVTTLGGPGQIHHAGWANVFVGHAMIDRRFAGGLLIGEVTLAACVGFHYVVILGALIRQGRRGRKETAG